MERARGYLQSPLRSRENGGGAPSAPGTSGSDGAPPFLESVAQTFASSRRLKPSDVGVVLSALSTSLKAADAAPTHSCSSAVIEVCSKARSTLREEDLGGLKGPTLDLLSASASASAGGRRSLNAVAKKELLRLLLQQLATRSASLTEVDVRKLARVAPASHQCCAHAR